MMLITAFEAVWPFVIAAELFVLVLLKAKWDEMKWARP